MAKDKQKQQLYSLEVKVLLPPAYAGFSKGGRKFENNEDQKTSSLKLVRLSAQI